MHLEVLHTSIEMTSNSEIITAAFCLTHCWKNKSILEKLNFVGTSRNVHGTIYTPIFRSDFNRHFQKVNNMALEVHQQEQIQVSTIGDTGVVAVAQRSTIEMGMPRNTSKLAFIRNTYPAHYNHVVRNMNSINYQTNTKAKHSMRGGHFLLYRYIISLAIILCLVFGVISIYVKGCASVPFILTVVYIAISIYNIVIYIKNRPLLNPLLAIQVPRDILPEFMNEFYTVPINATVLTGAIAAFVNPAVIAAAVRKDNV
ncbi:unnamed protein product, partial [Adineta ricciae]